MKTINKELYEYNDIIQPKNAKLLEVILQNLSDINTDMDWYDFIFDDFKEQIEKIGLTDVEIQFTGFWSQGDGASFTCRSFDIGKLLSHFRINTRHCLGFLADNINVSIKRNTTRYSHENTTFVDVELFYYKSLSQHKRFANEIDRIWVDLTHDLENYRRIKSVELYKRLQDCYEDLTSRESILATIELNAYTFNKEGKIES